MKSKGPLAFLLSLAFVLTYLRLYFGVDLIDEAFNVALPYRFALGDKPFVDEWALAQGTGLITAPLVKLYVLARGDTDGLVLFTRHLYFLMNCLMAVLFHRAMRRYDIDSAITAAAAMIYVCFIPFGLPNITYNTWDAPPFSPAFSSRWKLRRRDVRWVTFLRDSPTAWPFSPIRPWRWSWYLSAHGTVFFPGIIKHAPSSFTL